MNGEDFRNYTRKFKEGVSFVLDNIDENDPYSVMDLETPLVDYSNIESIGYYDGFIQGTDIVRTFQVKSMTVEQLAIIIDKMYGKAIEKRKEHIENNAELLETKYEELLYTNYKTGFLSGKKEVLTKYTIKDENFSVIPSVDPSFVLIDEYSVKTIGYNDGYCYYLNKILNQVEKNVELDEPTEYDDIESIIKESYNESNKQYNFSNLKKIATK